MRMTTANIYEGLMHLEFHYMPFALEKKKKKSKLLEDRHCYVCLCNLKTKQSV